MVAQKSGRGQCQKLRTRGTRRARRRGPRRWWRPRRGDVPGLGAPAPGGGKARARARAHPPAGWPPPGAGRRGGPERRGAWDSGLGRRRAGIPPAPDGQEALPPGRLTPGQPGVKEQGGDLGAAAEVGQYLRDGPFVAVGRAGKLRRAEGGDERIKTIERAAQRGDQGARFWHRGSFKVPAVVAGACVAGSPPAYGSSTPHPTTVQVRVLTPPH